MNLESSRRRASILTARIAAREKRRSILKPPDDRRDEEEETTVRRNAANDRCSKRMRPVTFRLINSGEREGEASGSVVGKETAKRRNPRSCWRAKGAGGEGRNRSAPPSSGRFSGRMAGAWFPRDPRRNAKRGIARVGGEFAVT